MGFVGLCYGQFLSSVLFRWVCFVSVWANGLRWVVLRPVLKLFEYNLDLRRRVMDSLKASSGFSSSLRHFSSSSPLCSDHPIPHDRFLSINFAINSSLWFLFIFPLSSFFIYCFLPRLEIKTLETRSMAMKPHGKSIMSSDSDKKIVFFKDLSLGPNEAQLRFRLIHFWEAWNPLKKTLIGMEMLLIDEQGTVIQGFISLGRIQKYMPDMKRGSVYKLNNFYGSRNKSVFRVADHTVTVSFAWNSELKVLLNCPTHFDADSFRFHSYEEFQANCDLKGDLYDVVGHMKLVNGHSIVEAPVLDEVEIAKARRVLIHVQSHEYVYIIFWKLLLLTPITYVVSFFSGPVMKLYLWDQAARDFCKKFNSYEGTPTVLLVTTVNTKTLGGTLALTSMSSSRVFMDYDVQPTIDYFSWLGSNPAIAEQVNAEVVTKRETMTIGEIFSYIHQESSKDAFFECTATIDDVVHGSSWYYISCSGCHSKVIKGPTSLICTSKKCGKVNASGVPQYLSKISVYDNSEQAVFVLLGDAGRDLTGKPASELVRSYFEANGNEGVDLEAPVPEALISTIGQKHKFCVKVTEHNFSGKTRSLTVTKILPLDSEPTTMSPEDNHTTATSGETSENCVDSADGSKRTCDSSELERVKRPKCGN
uniref:Replication factor A C-terminal domain-containing protein n=2 Tax=Brassica oleracea var. oleracea TaxID=109376 RepID=A0A0D2ZU11_BRAOL